MKEYTLAVVASLIIAAIMVYFVDKKFGGEDEGN
jgi:hypothetical protein